MTKRQTPSLDKDPVTELKACALKIFDPVKETGFVLIFQYDKIKYQFLHYYCYLNIKNNSNTEFLSIKMVAIEIGWQM